MLDDFITYGSRSGTFANIDVINNAGGLFVYLDDDSANNAYDLFLNTPPSGSIGNVNVNEDAADTIIDLAAAFGDLEHSDTELTFTIESNSNALLFDAVTVNDVADLLTLNYAANQNGSADIAIRATDPRGQFVVVTFTVNVASQNDAPVALDAVNVAIEDGTTITGQLTVTDDDPSDSHVFTLVSGTSEGTAVVNPDGSYSFDPGTDFQDLATGETRDVTFVYRATDDGVGTLSDDATVTITVTGTNDVPVITVAGGDSAAESIAETNATLTTTGTLSAFDVDLSDTVTSDVTGVVASGTVAGLGSDNATLLSMLASTTNVVNGTQTTGTLTSTFNSGAERSITWQPASR